LSEADVVWEVLIQVRSPEGGAPEGVPEPQENTKVQEPTLAVITLFLFLCFFLISKKINISMGTWKHIKLGELTRHNALGFLCWGISL